MHAREGCKFEHTFYLKLTGEDRYAFNAIAFECEALNSRCKINKITNPYFTVEISYVEAHVMSYVGGRLLKEKSFAIDDRRAIADFVCKLKLEMKREYERLREIEDEKPPADNSASDEQVE